MVKNINYFINHNTMSRALRELVDYIGNTINTKDVSIFEHHVEPSNNGYNVEILVINYRGYNAVERRFTLEVHVDCVMIEEWSKEEIQKNNSSRCLT